MTTHPAAASRRDRWGRVGLAAVLALSAFLDTFGLWNLGDGKLYYAAAVRSMLTGWHNLLYASFDAGGFLSIDKPPLGFWLQAASVRVLGFSGVALMLPQAAAGVASVALLHRLVARVWGRAAGLAAALLLALSPVSVVASRSNIVDGVLVLVLLLAAAAAARAAERGRLRWLVLCAALVGLGFNVKMLEAFLVVPALGLVYLVTAPVPRWRRIVHLGVAAGALAAVSLTWVVTVDLTPAGQRPYVGSSIGDSELNLALGYNGWGRVLGSPSGDRAARVAPRGPTLPTGPTVGVPATREAGAPGPLRLLEDPLGSQTGWLIPLALAGLVTAAVRQRWGRPVDARQRSLLLWGGWLLIEGAFFSVASSVHAYYLTMLSPAIAALGGIGLVMMGEAAVRSTRGRWLLVAALLGSAAETDVVLAGFPRWSRWLTLPVVIAAVVAALSVAIWRAWPGQARWRTGLAAIAGGVTVLAGPATWTASTIATRGDMALPTAGPLTAVHRIVDGVGVADATLDPGLLRYLEAHAGSSEYLMATLTAPSAAPYMLASDRPVMALGGFDGSDRIVDVGRLESLVSRGVVRYFVIRAAAGGRPGSGGPLAGRGDRGINDDLVTWVVGDCAEVPRAQWSTPRAGRAGPLLGLRLYDCHGAADLSRMATRLGPSSSARRLIRGMRAAGRRAGHIRDRGSP